MVELEDGSLRQCYPRGKKAGATVGDHVMVTLQGEEGSIERILERRNLLYRSDETRSKQFAANVDRLLIVVASEPMFSDDLAGRALVGAWSADIEPYIILNKCDLPSTDAARKRLAPFKALGVPIIETNATNVDQTRQTLLPLLQGRSSLLLGQSAMGKSTLLNALVPEADAATQEHSQALGAGKHTTTATRLYRLSEGGTSSTLPGFRRSAYITWSPRTSCVAFPSSTSPLKSAGSIIAATATSQVAVFLPPLSAAKSLWNVMRCICGSWPRTRRATCIDAARHGNCLGRDAGGFSSCQIMIEVAYQRCGRTPNEVSAPTYGEKITRRGIFRADLMQLVDGRT